MIRWRRSIPLTILSILLMVAGLYLSASFVFGFLSGVGGLLALVLIALAITAWVKGRSRPYIG